MQFLFIYDAHIDAWLHEHTKSSPNLEGVVAALRQQVDRVLATARQNHDEVLFYLFSDHGMCTINDHLDLFPLFDRLPLKMHEDYFCVIDSTMVRLWYNKPGAQDIIRDALASVPQLTVP